MIGFEQKSRYFSFLDDATILAGEKSVSLCARLVEKKTCGETEINYSCTRNVSGKVFSVFEPQGCGTAPAGFKVMWLGLGLGLFEQILSHFAMLLMSMMEVQINM